jgi:hypothetical protein
MAGVISRDDEGVEQCDHLCRKSPGSPGAHCGCALSIARAARRVCDIASSMRESWALLVLVVALG